MKRIKDIILSDKTPMNKNSLWLKDGNLKYFEGVWKNIDTSKMSTNTSDIILDNNKLLFQYHQIQEWDLLIFLYFVH